MSVGPPGARTLIRVVLYPILALLLWLCLSPWLQPRYQGKSLSEWLEDPRLSRHGSEAFNAFRHMGADAVPYLVDELRRGYTTNVFDKVRRRIGRPRDRHVHLERAGPGLAALGDARELAVPALAKLYEETRSHIVFGIAGSMGEAGRKFALQELNNPDPRIRGILWQLIENGDWQVPQLREVILKEARTRNPAVPWAQARAIHLLSNVGGSDPEVQEFLASRMQGLFMTEIIPEVIDIGRTNGPAYEKLKEITGRDGSHDPISVLDELARALHALERGANLSPGGEQAILNLLREKDRPATNSSWYYLRRKGRLRLLIELRRSGVMTERIRQPLESIAADKTDYQGSHLAQSILDGLADP